MSSPIRAFLEADAVVNPGGDLERCEVHGRLG
jgi:hypothetical protein